jgi:hypothetical protein
MMCMEMPAWVPAVSEGGRNILRTETQTSPISRAVVERELLQLSTNKQKIDGIMRQNRRITFRDIAVQLGVGHLAVREMMDILGYRKICSRWVPRLLTGTEEHKTAENCSPTHPTFRILPHGLPLVRTFEKSP